MRRRARDALAAQATFDMTPEAAPVLPDDALVRRGELGDALARMFACLSPAERMALVLHEVLECGHADIAATLGTTPANARQYLSRARRRLRACKDHAGPNEKRCRDLVRRFQAAINGRDVAALVTLLADEQPVSVREDAVRMRLRTEACANNTVYLHALAA